MLFFVNNFSFSFKITWLYACRSGLALSTCGFHILHVIVWNPGRKRLVKRHLVNRWGRKAGVLKGGFCFSW